MELLVENLLGSIGFGDMLVFGNMATLPLFTQADMGPVYISLDEAQQGHLSQITESSESGLFGELKVINHADVPLLLIDGEELVGCKQDRIINATILLEKKSETVIPVSCVEQHRWSYTSAESSTSPHIVPCFLRQEIVKDVNASLRDKAGYRSNQARVWDDLRDRASNDKVDSPTGAMEHVFYAKKEKLDEYLKAFEIKPGQKGILIFINGEVAGLDLVSRESAYMTLHPKLIRSYAIESLKKEGMKTKPSVEKARAFLAEAAHCVEEKGPLIGLGCNYRYEGEKVVGAALVYQDRVIHTSFFRKIDSSGSPSGAAEKTHEKIDHSQSDLKQLMNIAAEKNYGRGFEHADIVTELSRGLYKAILELQFFPKIDSDLFLLEASGYLHDVGVPPENNHNISGFKWLRERLNRPDVRGVLSDSERSIVLYCVLWHRNDDFSTKNEVKIQPPELKRARRLASLLRIADGLSYPVGKPTKRVNMLLERDTLVIEACPSTRGDSLSQQIKKALEKKSLLEEVLKETPRFGIIEVQIRRCSHPGC